MAEFSLTAPVRFLAGAEAPTGYVGYMSEIGRPPAWQTYLLKGGLSEDKQALLTAAAQLAAPWEPELELLMRSHREIEGVVCPQCRLCVLDATSPHAMDPTYWELSERLIATDSGILPERLLPMADTIIELTDNERLLGERYRKFAAAAASLLSENARVAWGCTDTDKIRRLAVRIAAAEVFPSQTGGERRRFLSAVTAEGVTVFYSTIQALCPKIYVIEDENGVCADLLLRELRRAAWEKGQPIVSCGCPLAPQDRMEHLLLPEAGVAFTTSNSFHKVDFPVYRRIHASRFTDAEGLRRHRQRMSFNRRAAGELLSEAAAVAAERDGMREQLRKCRGSAVDPARSADLRQQFIRAFSASLDARRETP